MNDDPVRDLLLALAEADTHAEASPEIEIRLRKKFRSWKRRRVMRQAVVVGVAAAAVIILTFTLTNRRNSTAPVNALLPGMPVATSPDVSVSNEPVEEPVLPVRKPIPPEMPEPEEIVTEFFPLMDPAPPFGRGQLLRVELPASAMQMVGLPVLEDYLEYPVQADVLVGEDGLPRAIRFIKIETSSEGERYEDRDSNNNDVGIRRALRTGSSRKRSTVAGEGSHRR
jgi:hypothetical protein